MTALTGTYMSTHPCIHTVIQVTESSFSCILDHTLDWPFVVANFAMPAATFQPTEQSPLLRDSTKADHDDDDAALENGEAHAEDGEAANVTGVPIPDEPSNQRLAWILGSVYVGVFLAALGMLTPHLGSILWLTFSSRWHRHSNLDRPNIDVFQVTVPDLLAGLFLSHLECRFSALGRPSHRHLLPSNRPSLLQLLLCHG